MFDVLRVLEADLAHGHIEPLLAVLRKHLNVLHRDDVVLLRVQEHVRPHGRRFVEQALEWAAVQQRPMAGYQVLDDAVAVLDDPDADEADGDEQGHGTGTAAVDGGEGAVQGGEATVAGRRVVDAAADVEVALLVAGGGGVLEGQQDVHVHVGAAVAEQVHENGIVLKVHVVEEFEDLLAEQLHVGALPEEAVDRRRVPNGYQSEGGRGEEERTVVIRGDVDQRRRLKFEWWVILIIWGNRAVICG